MLKPYVPDPAHVLDDKHIVMSTQNTLEIQPDCILDTRERNPRNRTLKEHLVPWKGYPNHDATWKRKTCYVKFIPSFSRDEDISNSISWGGCNVPTF